MNAPCADDPDLFFPPLGSHITDIRLAKAICAGCDMRRACLTFALEHHIRDGIWGGTTREERKAIWRNERAAA